MRNFFPLLGQELRVMLVTPATYVAAILSLLLIGTLYLWMLFQISQQPATEAPMVLFLGAFWLPVLLLVPMLTMRSIAEERRLGTLEVILAASVRPVELVLAKFAAAYLFYMLVWVVAGLYPLLTVRLLDTAEVTGRLLEPAQLVGAGLFLALTGALFVAVGIFSSALTRSQLVAGMLCFSIIFILIIGVWVMQEAGTLGAFASLLDPATMDYLQVFDHFEDFLQGVIDSRPAVYYLSSTALILGLAVLVVEAKA